MGAGLFNAACGGVNLLLRFHRTGSGNDHEVVAAELHPANVDDRVDFVKLPTDQFVGRGDLDNTQYAGHLLES